MQAAFCRRLFGEIFLHDSLQHLEDVSGGIPFSVMFMLFSFTFFSALPVNGAHFLPVLLILGTSAHDLFGGCPQPGFFQRIDPLAEQRLDAETDIIWNLSFLWGTP